MRAGNISPCPAAFWQANNAEPSLPDAINDPSPAAATEGWLFRDLLIVNRKGLHARATAKFVQCAERFDAEITVTRCGETVGGTSIMGILTLGAGIGTKIAVAARGREATLALNELDKLVADRFGEDE
jgi:phosphocarrier protein HPr